MELRSNSYNYGNNNNRTRTKDLKEEILRSSSAIFCLVSREELIDRIRAQSGRIVIRCNFLLDVRICNGKEAKILLFVAFCLKLILINTFLPYYNIVYTVINQTMETVVISILFSDSS